MKRVKIFFVACLLFVLCVLGLGACAKGGEVEATLLSVNDTQVVIRVDKTDGKAVLLDAMENLRKKGELNFILSEGMITEINGVENDADYNPCWMLYTSDDEMSTIEWGIEYGGKICGSAIVGAEYLTVTNGEIYIWVYQSF